MLSLSILIVCFILLSGMWAMVDTAVLSVSHAEVEEMIGKKLYGARPLKTLQKHLTKTIITLAILTNITNILGPVWIGHWAGELFESAGIGIVTAILTFGTILFSEIIPKAIGAHYSPTISRCSAPLIRAAVWVLTPIVWVLDHFVKLFKSGERHIGTEEQIRALVNMGGTAGHIDSDERKLIHRAFVLNDRKAKDIMKPLSEVIGIPMNATMRRAAKVVFDNPYSRYPVYGTSMDDIGGVVFSHEILQMMADDEEKKPVTTVLHPVLFVQESERADDLLNLFRKKQMHLAIVQSGVKTIGVVTLEDVLEELVGEIEDERDAAQEV